MAAPVDGARAGVEYRERKRDGNAAGGHPRFFEEDADHRMIFAPHGSRPSAPPDARSGEPSTHAMVEVGGVPAAESKARTRRPTQPLRPLLFHPNPLRSSR